MAFWQQQLCIKGALTLFAQPLNVYLSILTFAYEDVRKGLNYNYVVHLESTVRNHWAIQWRLSLWKSLRLLFENVFQRMQDQHDKRRNFKPKTEWELIRRGIIGQSVCVNARVWLYGLQRKKQVNESNQKMQLKPTWLCGFLLPVLQNICDEKQSLYKMHITDAHHHRLIGLVYGSSCIVPKTTRAQKLHSNSCDHSLLAHFITHREKGMAN